MRFILPIIFCFFFVNAIAQLQLPPCGFDQLQNRYDLESVEADIQKGILQAKSKSGDSVYTIPVVVHVIHNGGSENISDAQVQSGIDVMNEDYGKLPGTPGDGNGVDTKIRYVLANTDPNGHCTNGIVRIKTEMTNHEQAERLTLKQLSSWDNSRYLNIYVVDDIAGGTAGYSSFPGGPPDEDGFVIEDQLFGTVGTASGSMGRTATHESGHWLGLYHTFQDGCGTDTCLDGDKVCDTPPAASPNYGCPTINSCSIDNPDVNDQIENYMDYSDDNCQNMFTAGQRDRAHGTLNSIRTVIWSDSNLVASGTDSAYTPPASCPVVANLITLNPQICIGNDLYFMDISLNDATTWEWTFPGGNPSTSTDENPTVQYDSVGVFDVMLKVSNGSSTDSITFSNYVNVSLPGTGDDLPLHENFEDYHNWPQDYFSIVNYDNGITWELDSNAASEGTYSISINNLESTNYGTRDELVTPFLNFTSLDSNYFFKFKYAYARSVSTYSDELVVEISTDCEGTWEQLISKSGNSLATGPTQTTPFIPDSSQWRQVALDMSAYKDEAYVRIRFVNITDGGNFLYLDDIQIGDIFTSLDETTNNKPKIRVYPNPAQEKLWLQTNDATPGQSVVLNLYSMEGKKVLSETCSSSISKGIDVSALPQGMYFYEITSLKGTPVGKGKVILK